MQITKINNIFSKYNTANSAKTKQHMNFENDSFSFCGTGIDGNKMRKGLSGITCPCCGIAMLNSKDLKQALSLPDNASSKQVLRILSKYEKSMHPVEKNIFQQLQALSKIYPRYSIRQLLDTQRDKNLLILHNDENKIIERIRHVGSFLSEESQEVLEKTLKEADSVIADRNIDTVFKRKAFIGKIRNAAYSFKEKDIAETIIEIARELPRAGNNPSAFIVKFTQKRPSTGEERTSHEIINALIAPSLGTIEHVKVRSPLMKNGGGANEMGNYLLECCRDNNMRDSMPLAEFVEQHPEFYGKNLQKYIDEIIERINKGKLTFLAKYPVLIAETLYNQSEGKLKVDISKLTKK